MTATTVPPSATPSPDSATGWLTTKLFSSESARQRIIGYSVAAFIMLCFVRSVTGAYDLTSSGTVTATLKLGLSITFAALAGLWSERAGIVNIGIEGMMTLGAWAGGFGAWKWGAWAGLGLAIVGGMLGGLIHAVSVVRFNVDHVISGFALNLLAAGSVRYLSAINFTGHTGGSISQSPHQKSAIREITVRFIAGKPNFSCSDAQGLASIECKRWFLVSDTAGVLRGFLSNLSVATVLGILLVPASGWVLWRTRFGLRVRSSGESPSAAESLGVKVSFLRYRALAIGGAMAGFGGGYLAIVANPNYKENITGGRGYIGLATLIFGNWRPGGLLSGSMLFGYTNALILRDNRSIPALFLLIGLVMLVVAVRGIIQKKTTTVIVGVMAATLFFVAKATVSKVPDSLASFAPYLVTLIVLATASQRLRPPAFDGKPYRSGEGH